MKKQKTLYSIIAIIIVLFIAADTYFNFGVMDSILSLTDNEAPIIHTDDLRSRYLLDEEFTLEVSCEDNVDGTCTVEVIGEFDTSVLGENTVTLKAEDKAGHATTFSYTYEIIEEYDGSLYIPLGYYNSINGLEGEALKTELHDIIDDNVVYPYTDDDTDVWDILREADEDPDNENNVILFYTGLSLPKDCQDSNDVPSFCELYIYDETKLVEWNREHIWSKSRGGFDDASGLDAYTDTHNLVAAERVMNSTKNNRFYEDCNDGDDTNIVDRGYGNYTCNVGMFEPRDEVKGDVARMIFYMAVRYDDAVLDLELVNDPIDGDDTDGLPIYGDIDDLLRWHIEDPVSEKEVLRNEVIYSYQENRNPFIDMPGLVELIWGTADNYQLMSTSNNSYYSSSLTYRFNQAWASPYNQVIDLDENKTLFM